jgi:hypothetical protein
MSATKKKYLQAVKNRAFVYLHIIYRTIKLICNRVIHESEIVCRFLNKKYSLKHRLDLSISIEKTYGNIETVKVAFFCERSRNTSSPRVEVSTGGSIESNVTHLKHLSRLTYQLQLSITRNIQ